MSLGVLRILFVALLALQGVAEDNPLLAQTLASLPAGVQPVVLMRLRDATGLAAEGDGVSTTLVAVDGQPFSQACSVTVAHAVRPAARAHLHATAIGQEIGKGHVLLTTFWIRSGPQMGEKSAIVHAHLVRSRPTWASLGQIDILTAPAWRRLSLVAHLEERCDADTVRLSLQLGEQEQTVEVGGVEVLDLGPTVDESRLPSNPITWPGMESDAAWRTVAEKRIADCRQAQLTVRVVDAAGTLMPRAQVTIRQRRRSCAIGSFTGAEGPLGRRGPEVQAQYARLYSEVFDRATVPLYWADWGWPKRRDLYLGVAHWAAATEAALRGHVLIYPGWQYLPADLKSLRNDPVALQARILAQIRTMGESFRTIPFREIDVTNELRDLTDITDLLGRDAVVEWFAVARQAFPGVKLALNENAILTNGGHTDHNQEVLLEWYRFLKAHGQAPDVLGFQGHFSEAVTAPETVWRILDRFASETQAELQITEFDFTTRNEAAQAAYTRDFLTACFAHPRVTGISLWGFWQGDHWRPDAASWRTDWSAKPAGAVLSELLRRSWRTDVAAATADDGTLTALVFRGDLLVSAAAQGRRTELVVAMEGSTTVTLRLPP